MTNAIEFPDIIEMVLSSSKLAFEKKLDRWFDQEDRSYYYHYARSDDEIDHVDFIIF